MTHRLALASLAAGLLAAGPAAAYRNPDTTQWVLTTAKVTGAGGEKFVSSLRIVNPNPTAAKVVLTYLPQSPLDASFSASGDNTNAVTATVTVPANQTLPIDDVIGTKFAGAGPFGVVAGGVKVTSDVPVSVLSRTFNSAAVSQTGVAGTYGFSIPSQVADELVASGDTAYVPYVAAAPDRTAGYRSNFHMLNTASGTTKLHVKLLKGDGTTAGERDYTLAPFAATQQNDVAASFGATSLSENLTIVVTVVSGGPAAVGVSVIDNAIASINFVPPSKIYFPNNGSFGLIFDDSYGFSGRLDIFGGLPDFLTAGVVLEGCPAPNPTQLYYIQAFTSGSNQNSTFTKSADGSYALAGSSSSASWSGTIRNDVDGTIYGTITYTRAAGAAGGSCPAISRTMLFSGSRAVAFAAP